MAGGYTSRRRYMSRWTPAVAHLAGRALEAFPVVSPEEVREGFDRWNTLGLSRAAAEAAARDAEAGGDGEVVPGVSAGFSSGSSGRPGLFLSSRVERAAYLGHMIARLLPTSDSSIGSCNLSFATTGSHEVSAHYSYDPDSAPQNTIFSPLRFIASHVAVR